MGLQVSYLSQQLSSPYFGLRGLDTANFYSLATGTDLDGNGTGFEIFQASIIDGTTSTGVDQCIISSLDFLVGGWGLGKNPSRPLWVIYNNVGAPQSVGIGNYVPAIAGKFLLISSVGYDGTNRFFTLNGQVVFSVAMAGYGAGAQGVKIGKSADGAQPMIDGVSLLAVGAKTDGILSAANWETQLNSLLTTGNFANDNLTSRYSIKDIGAGAAPATLEDQIGTNDFTLTGALTISNQGTTGYISYG